MPRRTHTLISLVLICAVSSVLLTGPASARGRGGAGPGVEPSASERAVHAVRKEIAAIELFNALDLDAPQQAALATLIGDALAEREGHHAAREAAAPELERILQGYLAELKKAGAPSDDTVAALKAFHETNRPDRSERKDGREAGREALEAILSEAQLQTLRSFQPMAAVRPSPPEHPERRQHGRDAVRGVLKSPEFLALLD